LGAKSHPYLWAQSEVVLLGTHWELEEHVVDPELINGELDKNTVRMWEL